MRKSIHWSLQLWHALLLLLVVLIFGGTLGYRLVHSQYQSIDTELEGQAQLLAARLRPPRPPPPPAQNRGRGFDGPPREGPPPDQEPFPGDDFGRGRGGRRRGGFNERGPRGPADLNMLNVPPDLERRIADAPGAPYYQVWRPDGTILRASQSAPQALPPPRWDGPLEGASTEFRQRGDLREAIVPGPLGTMVVVGRSIKQEQADLRKLIEWIIVTGASVLLVGLLGGWMLSRRAVRPIAQITEIAQNISAIKLSERIDSSDTESELGALATVLNGMFDRLESSFARQVRFTADASHELRTPLSVIRSHAELALTRQRSAEEYRKTIETCLRAAKRMSALVESLLVLARADAGRLELHRENFDLVEVINECMEMIAPMAQERGITLERQLEPLEVNADRNRIAQLLTNLLTNAVRYNRDVGKITVGLRHEGIDAVISVADTGVGIAPIDQPRVFERFFRADPARSREAGGSGLGLAICQSIVEAHGGQITFTSQSDQGTTFIVRLPVLITQVEMPVTK